MTPDRSTGNFFFQVCLCQGYKIHSWIRRDYSEYERLNKLNLLPLKYCREINDLVFFFKCLKGPYSASAIFDAIKIIDIAW